jgi:NAD(P)-dependent dehydrogenase (short-subunit alcohol dehydrogenase family)
MESIHGKTILVTGAAKRIGRSIALRLAREGARILIHFNGSEDEARKTAEECGHGAQIFRANLESVAEIEALFAAVKHEAGKLDGLVNNAARFTKFHPFDVTERDWDFIHSVNLKAAFFCNKEAAKLMREQGTEGRIVNISSLGGIRPWADHAHYCASKAGLIHMTRALAKAFAPDITVNSVAPGVIPYAEANDPEILKMVEQTPAQRAGTGEEIGEAVLYFLTAGNYVTGQLMAVDGGLSQR